MARKPLPGESTTTPAGSFRQLLTQAAESQQARISQYRWGPTHGNPAARFQTHDPRFTAPGPFHVAQVGEGITWQARLDDVPEYSVDLIRRYRTLSPTEQYRVRWAVAMKPSWSFAELQAYRQAAFGTLQGPNPFAEIPPYDVSMIQRYSSLSPSEQLRVRYSVSQKVTWSWTELQAYRQAAFGAPTGAGITSAAGTVRDPTVQRGTATTAPGPGRTGPAGAAAAFTRLGESMRGLAGQTRRAGEALHQLRTDLPDMWGPAESNVGLITVTHTTESEQI